MKLPKIKKRTMHRVMEFAGLCLLSFGYNFYGYYNHLAGQNHEWDYLSKNADNSGSIWIHEGGDFSRTDNMYLMTGKEGSKKIWDEIQEDNKNEQGDSE
jgi:hypothetical protein